jgi:hypothetical protein
MRVVLFIVFHSSFLNNFFFFLKKKKKKKNHKNFSKENKTRGKREGEQGKYRGSLFQHFTFLCKLLRSLSLKRREAWLFLNLIQVYPQKGLQFCCFCHRLYFGPPPPPHQGPCVFMSCIHCIAVWNLLHYPSIYIYIYNSMYKNSLQSFQLILMFVIHFLNLTSFSFSHSRGKVDTPFWNF